MKTGLKLALTFGFGMALLQFTAAAQIAPPSTVTATNAPKLSPKEMKENMSYAIGTDIGRNFKRGGVELDLEVLTTALKEAVAGGSPKLTDPQIQEAIGNYRKEAMAKREEERHKTAEKNRTEGAAFLAENKSKPGIKTLEVKLADGKTAELQYKVVTEGTGPIPKTNDTVTANYRGTLINGKEFDSSAKRGGQPFKFLVTRVVRGWTEAIQRMPVGSKWELYLPSSLAYGDNGFGAAVEPGATLIFDMELTGIEAPQPPQAAPPPAQPLTSDIIRVPSAEELKKGAKIEVIKPEDLEKLTNAAAQKAEKK
jgi:FKBP-type peptidyl-prolyl cis-trans isomerase FklB